jgi:hypothetical protein
MVGTLIRLKALANGGVEALGGCGQEPLQQYPLKARGSVEIAQDSQVASNTWLARRFALFETSVTAQNRSLRRRRWLVKLALHCNDQTSQSFLRPRRITPRRYHPNEARLAANRVGPISAFKDCFHQNSITVTTGSRYK